MALGDREVELGSRAVALLIRGEIDAGDGVSRGLRCRGGSATPAAPPRVSAGRTFEPFFYRLIRNRNGSTDGSGSWTRKDRTLSTHLLRRLQFVAPRGTISNLNCWRRSPSKSPIGVTPSLATKRGASTRPKYVGHCSKSRAPSSRKGKDQSSDEIISHFRPKRGVATCSSKEFRV